MDLSPLSPEKGNMKKNKENFVDRVPQICADKKWTVLEDGIVEITVENKGFYNVLAQKFFSKPRYSFIKLDTYGSFVWKQIDGKRTIYEIGKILEENYEEAGTKLYERLCTFFKILENNRYVQTIQK